MKIRSIVLPLLSAAMLSATDVSQIDLSKEPHHHLILENSLVRVYHEELPVGEATVKHIHLHDAVGVALGDATVSAEVEGKAPVTAKYKYADTAFNAPGPAHVIRNIGSTPLRTIGVEFLQDEEARKSPPAKWDEERGMHVLDHGTQDILFVKDGVRVSEIDLQPGGSIPKHHHVGPHLVIALTDLHLHSEIVGRGMMMTELKTGEVKWVPGDFTHTLMNVGSQPAKFITLEFH